MLLKVKCEYCGNEELLKTDVIGTYYCDVCDDDIELGELEIEVIEDIKES